MKVRLVDSKGKEIDVPVKLEKAVAEYRAEAEANPNPGELTTKMIRLVKEMEEIMGLERGKIKAVLSTAWWGARVVGRKWNVTLYFLD